MQLKKIIDSLTETLERIKTVGIIVLALLFVVSLVQNGCSRSELNHMVEKITGLNVQNDILKKDISEKDSLLIASKDSVRVLKDSIFKVQSRTRALEFENVRLGREYNSLAAELIKISADSSYSFLDREAYPYGGVKKFPFSEPQIKGIHKTYLEKEQLLAMNNNLESQKEELFKEIALRDALEVEVSSAMNVMQETRRDMEQIIENKDEEIKMKEKQAKKQKRRNVLKIIGVGIASLIVGFVAG